MRRALPWLLLLGAIWPMAAHSAVLFQTGFDLCQIDTMADLDAWSAGDGLPTVSTTVDVTANNRCSLQFTPAASTKLDRRSPTFTATDTAFATIRFRCDTLPTAASPLLTLYSVASSARGATAWIVPADLDKSKFQIKAYYKNIGPSCTASLDMDGTPCGATCTTSATCVQGGGVGADVLACDKGCLGGDNRGKACATDADCPCSEYGGCGGANTCSSSKMCLHECNETAEGESRCSAFSNANSSPVGLNTGTWYLATLGHEKGTGTVKVSLWGGPAGSPSASLPLGTTAHKEGICAGGTRANYACAVNGDCPSSTCTTTDVVQVDSVIIGSDVTTAGSYACTIDELWVESDGPHYNGAIQSLAVSGEGGIGNWSMVRVGTPANGCATGVEWGCVNDGTAPDADSSTLTNTFAAQPTIGLVLANAATPTAPMPSPTPLAVVMEVLGKNHASSGSSTVRLDVADDSSSGAFSNGTAFDFGGFSDSGASATYHAMPPRLRASRVDTTAWTFAGIDALILQMTKGGTSAAVRVSSIVASVLYGTANPVTPTNLTDHDGDGKITVCLAGDSTWADFPFAADVSSPLTQPDNILICAKGGTTIGDLRADLADILQGKTTQYMKCAAYKGSTDAKCDVLLVGPGANNFRHGNFADPSNPSTLHGTSQPGYCDMKGDAGEGASCSCPPEVSRGKAGTWTRYWRLRNAAWKQATTTCADATCSVNADCGSTGVCTSGFCTYGDLAANCSVGSTRPLEMCVSGCLNAPGCLTGLCVTNPADADFDVAQIKDVILTAEAAAWAPKVIAVTAPPPIRRGGYACWTDTQGKNAAYNQRLLTWVKATGRPFVDLAARSVRDCPSLGTLTCFRPDGIHRSDFGNAVSARGITDCLTNAGGTHDGVYNGSTKCTAGRVNATLTTEETALATDADCDTWRCPSL